jgi:LPS-assembly lipoprotein
MRHVTPLPFDSLSISIADNSRFGVDLRRAIHAISPGTRLVNDPKEAQAHLQQIANHHLKRAVSLNAQGRIEEYELTLQFSFRVTDAEGNILIPDTTLETSRDMAYNDQFAQAKARQMETLFQNMEQSMINRIIHRLSALNAPPAR